MTPMRRVVFGLGSNLGGRLSMLRAAYTLLAYAFDGRVEPSRARWTAPVGPPQPTFANAAVLVHTDAPPEALLSIALRAEARLGRVRAERWGPRTLDVDVLWIDGESVSSADLTIPHARLRERAFALAPLLDLVPDARDPRDAFRYADALETLGATDAGFSLGDGFATSPVMNHTADEGFTVVAPDRADALAGAAEALAGTMVDPTGVRPAQVLAVEARCDDPAGFADDAERAHAWLSEVLFTLDARRVAARRVCVLEDEPGSIRGFILGEPLCDRHTMRTAVKAITWHDLHAARDEDGDYHLRVILDV
jgi:2-amino-4-hydroxy-6-hydroxymethyldihydropteridine diphosphokinase